MEGIFNQTIIKSSQISSTSSFFLRFSMIKHPKIFFYRLFLIGMFYFSLMIKISEGLINKPESPSSWDQCIWLAFITMLTVGFGDTTPNTYWGRLFSILCGIFGYTFFSILVITVNQIIAFNKSESSVYTIIGKLIQISFYNSINYQFIITIRRLIISLNNNQSDLCFIFT